MEDGIYVGRRYGDQGSGSAHGFYRDNTNKGDIFGFILAEKSSMAVTLPDPSKTHKSAPKATLLGHYVENITEINNDVLCPDVVVFLDGTLLTLQTTPGFAPYTPTRSKSVLPHLIHPMHAESPFGELIKSIWERYHDGLTAHIPLETYLYYQAKTEPNLTWATFANVPHLEQMDLVPGQPLNIVTPIDHLKEDLVPLGKQKL